MVPVGSSPMGKFRAGFLEASPHPAQPVRKQLPGVAPRHPRNREVVFLSGKKPDAVVVHIVDLVDGDIHGVV